MKSRKKNNHITCDVAAPREADGLGVGQGVLQRRLMQSATGG